VEYEKNQYVFQVGLEGDSFTKPQLYVGVSLLDDETQHRKAIGVTLSKAIQDTADVEYRLPNRRHPSKVLGDPFLLDMILEGDLESDSFHYALGGHRNETKEGLERIRPYGARRYAFELALGRYLKNNGIESGGKITIPDEEFKRQTNVSFKKEK
jgi:hypothetical protein